MKYELPQLPYELDALEPVISKRTMEFHYGKHLQTYLDNLNKLIQGTDFENADLETIVKKSEGPMFNNGAQTWNHIFYFFSLTPEIGEKPDRPVIRAIEEKWGSLENFQKEFVDAGASIFGSGWVWLVKNKEGGLEIVKEGNAGNPMTSDKIPLLTFDVWEHAYYLDYQNRRADQLKAMWNIVNWDIVDARYL